MGNRRRIWLSLLLALSLPLYLAGCGSDTAAPGEPSGPGVFTVDVSSGNGTIDHADSAGSFAVFSYPGGGIRSFTGGTADPSFTVNVPAATPIFGTESLVVTDNLMVLPGTTAVDVAPDDNAVRYYLGPRTVDTNTVYAVWHRQADNVTFKQVTGIQVPANRVLELQFNFPGNNLGSVAAIDLPNDLEVAGTLRTAVFDCAATQVSADGLSRGGLDIQASGVFIRSTGKVITAGTSPATGPAGNGGVINLASVFGNKNGGFFLNEGTIDASGGASTDNVGGNGSHFGAFSLGVMSSLQSDGYLINKGAVTASGGNGGTTGGHSFGVQLLGRQHAYNTAAVSAKGGNGSGGAGGTAFNGIIVAAGMFNAYNSGALTASGGNGTVSGGAGTWVQVGNGWDSFNRVGDTLNKGAIDTRGGGSTVTAGGVGGTGGNVDIWASGGKMITSGDITTNGGFSADNTSFNHGGVPGNIWIGSDDGFFDSGPRGSNEVAVSGNLSSKGGAGYFGENGGSIEIGNFGSLSAGSKGGVTLYGYSAFVGNGGNAGAVGSAGSGGSFAFYSGGGFARDQRGPGTIPIAPPGPIVNRVAISGNGGTAVAGSGGSGGFVAFDAAEVVLLPTALAGGVVPVSSVTNSGAVSLNGAQGNQQGGSGGALFIVAGADISATGAVTAGGGINATDNGFSGGTGGFMLVSSTTGNAAVSGGIALNGANSRQFAGSGGALIIESKSSSLSGTVAANGGNAAFSTAGTSAGFGGFVEVTSQPPASSAVSATVSVLKGTGGALTRTNGSVVIDGIDRVSAGGTFP